MLSVLSAGVAPGFALLSYFYLKDKYDAEPISLVLKTFIFGGLLVFPIMFIQYVFEVEQLVETNFSKAFFSIALLEEFFKWFILFYTIYQHVEFDEPYDGIVYGVSVSLGFATVENILFLFAHGVEHAIGRALLPVSSHALFGVMMGFYLGKAKFSSKEKKWWIILSMFLPFLFHGLYDYILLTFNEWVWIIVPFMLFLWWLALRKVKLAHKLSLPQ